MRCKQAIKRGRPTKPELITIDDALKYIRELKEKKHPLLKPEDISRLCMSKGTLYNWRSSEKLTPYEECGVALIDRRELDALCG